MISQGGKRTREIPVCAEGEGPVVSVITVVYNGGEYIEETIRSVLTQSYGCIEYIILDGGSDDDTLDIIRKYDDRIDLWVSEPDQGMYDALNKAMSLASGDIIASLNSDDRYADTDVVSAVVDSYRNTGGKCFIYGDPVYDFGDKQVRRRLHRTSHDELVAFGDCTLVPQPASFISSELVRGVGNFDLTYRYASDYDYIIRCFSQADAVVYIDRCITIFRRHEDAITSVYADRMRAESRGIADGYGRRGAFMLARRMAGYARYILRNPQVLVNRLRGLAG